LIQINPRIKKKGDKTMKITDLTEKVGIIALALLLILVGLPLWVAAQSSSQAHPIELKFGLFTAPNHPITLMTREISNEVEKTTNGRVIVKVFDSGILGTGPGTLDAIQKGVMDIGTYVWTYAPMKQMPFLMAGGLPFVYRDGAGFIDAWVKEDKLTTMANEYVHKYGYDNVLFMATYFNGFGKMGFRDKEVKVPADLKGLKIRGTGTYIKIIESYKATAVTINSPDVYGALERGLIDGAMGLYTNWVNWKWMEPSKYLLDFNFAPVGAAITMNKTSWAKLPDRDKKLVGEYIKKLQAAENKYYIDLEESGEKAVKKHMKVYEPTPEQRKLWSAPKDAIIGEWLKAAGEKAGNEALAVIEKYNR
jgi:TRAP-type C4-dicarboxylate transport system substrate-binding protein